MSQQTIEITVDPEGRVRVETKGFAGPACREAGRFVERALGAATAETLTAEFFRAEQAERRLSQSE